jgi:hypothetical protein
MSATAPDVKALSTRLRAANARYAQAQADADVLREDRDALVLAMARAGASLADIGAVLGTTRSRAWQIVDRARG